MERSTEKIVIKGTVGVLVILLIGFTVLFVGALTGGKETGLVVAAPSLITEQQALAVAQTVVEGTPDGVELTEINGVLLYAVEFESNSKEYEVQIDPYTGKVLHVMQETELGPKEIDMVNPAVSETQARGIALQAVPGTVTEVEAAKVDGVYVWEIEVTDSQGESDVLVNMMTGKVVGIERELADDGDEDDQDSETSESYESGYTTQGSGSVTRDEAIQIAEDRLSSSFDFEEIGTGRFGGREVWEVEFEDSNEEAEVIIDRQTGEILKIEYEDEDDD